MNSSAVYSLYIKGL